MSFLSAAGKGNMLSARSQGPSLGLLTTSRRERAVLDLSATQVQSNPTKRDEISGAFGELLKPGGGMLKKVPRARRKSSNKSVSSRAASAARNRRSVRRVAGTTNKITGKTIVTPAQVKNTLRNSWYRLRSTVQSFNEIEEGKIQLGQMYALCQNHLLGLDTEQTTALLADSMSTNIVIDADESKADDFDTIEVIASLVLPVLEKHIAKQWDNVLDALGIMPPQLSLAQVQRTLATNGVTMTVGELCHVPDWTTVTLTNRGMSSSRSSLSNRSNRSSRSMLRTRQGNNIERVELILREKIKRTWRRMNDYFRKECTSARRGGMVDMRQFKNVLSKFGIQLAHDDLVTIFIKFDNNNEGL